MGEAITCRKREGEERGLCSGEIGILTHSQLPGFFLLAHRRWGKEQSVDLGGSSIIVAWSL